MVKELSEIEKLNNENNSLKYTINLERKKRTFLYTMLGLSTATLFYFAGCPRTIIKKEAVPFYTGNVENKTYEMDVNEDGLKDRIYVSDFAPRIELQNSNGTYKTIDWKPKGYKEYMEKTKND